MKNVSLKDKVEFLKFTLATNEAFLYSYYMGTSPTLEYKKNCQRLDKLFQMVYYLHSNYGLEFKDLHMTLKRLCFPDIQGNMDSAISALKQDKYHLEELLKIVELSYRIGQKS